MKDKECVRYNLSSRLGWPTMEIYVGLEWCGYDNGGVNNEWGIDLRDTDGHKGLRQE